MPPRAFIALPVITEPYFPGGETEALRFPDQSGGPSAPILMGLVVLY